MFGPLSPMWETQKRVLLSVAATRRVNQWMEACIVFLYNSDLAKRPRSNITLTLIKSIKNKESRNSISHHLGTRNRKTKERSQHQKVDQQEAKEKEINRNLVQISQEECWVQLTWRFAIPGPSGYHELEISLCCLNSVFQRQGILRNLNSMG